MADYDPFAGPEEPKKEEEEPKEPEKPSLDELLAEERRKREEAERKWQEQSAMYEGRLQQLSEFLKTRYESKTEAQSSKPEDDEPLVTDEDFDRSPSEAARLAAREEMQQALKKVNEFYSGVFGSLAEQTFEAQLSALEKERFYPYVKNDVIKFFQDNPQAKLTPKAAKMVYDQYVGGRIDELLELEQKEQKDRHELTTEAPRPSLPSAPRTPPPRMPSTSKSSSTPTLEGREAEIFQIYKRYGVFEDEEDWHRWKQAIGVVPRQELPQNLREA